MKQRSFIDHTAVPLVFMMLGALSACGNGSDDGNSNTDAAVHIDAGIGTDGDGAARAPSDTTRTDGGALPNTARTDGGACPIPRGPTAERCRSLAAGRPRKLPRLQGQAAALRPRLVWRLAWMAPRSPRGMSLTRGARC